MVIGNLLSDSLTSGALEKLTIYYESGMEGAPPGSVKALFNPNEISITRAVTWMRKEAATTNTSADYEPLEFRGAAPATMTITLFFDTYEGDPARLALTIPGVPQGTSVLRYTEQVANLARLDQEMHRPPVCTLQWGRFEIFTGVLTNLVEKFTMFMPDGTPVRASLTCTFTQERGNEYAKSVNELHSSDVAKVRLVKRRDTLQSIAAQEYGDAALWRAIARANGILNPRTLIPGTALTIPPLKK